MCDTMDNIKEEKNDSKYIKHFHQTGYTGNPDLFLSQLLGNLSDDLTEFGALKSFNIENSNSLDSTIIAQTPQKPGRKKKDVGKSSRTYSKEEAKNISSLLDSNILNGDKTKFDKG